MSERAEGGRGTAASEGEAGRRLGALYAEGARVVVRCAKARQIIEDARRCLADGRRPTTRALTTMGITSRRVRKRLMIRRKAA